MAGKLKPLDIQREEKPGKYADGDGLYLIVASETSKNWSYRYWFKGKQRWHGLGSFKDVSLKDARLARDAARLQVRASVDRQQRIQTVDTAVKEREKSIQAKRPAADRDSTDWLRVGGRSPHPPKARDPSQGFFFNAGRAQAH